MGAFIISVGSAVGRYMSQESFMILPVSHARNLSMFHIYICMNFFFQYLHPAEEDIWNTKGILLHSFWAMS